MQAKSIKGISPAEIQTALNKSKADGFKPTLAIIVLSNIENAEPIRGLFNQYGIEIFGVSTFQKFTEQGMESADIAVLLMDMQRTHFKIVLNDYEELSTYEAAYRAGVTGKNFFSNPGFIISPVDRKMTGDDLINGLTDAAGNDITVIGGVAGNPADFTGVVFTNHTSVTNGLLTLILDQDKITINGLAVSGWKPVGTEKKVTKSEGSWIFTIDNEPAMDVIQRFLGQEIVSPDKQAIGLIPSDLGYPLQFKRASGDVIMKPLLLWNTADKSILVGGQLNEGDCFRFSMPPDFDVIDIVVESTRHIKEKEMPDADALIVFSCVGRLGSFGPMITTEIEGLAATWNKPMIGFFSLGEFGKLEDGRSEFHGTTVSWLALKEK
jgi:hypothetical protein